MEIFKFILLGLIGILGILLLFFVVRAILFIKKNQEKTVKDVEKSMMRIITGLSVCCVLLSILGLVFTILY